MDDIRALDVEQLLELAEVIVCKDRIYYCYTYCNNVIYCAVMGAGKINPLTPAIQKFVTSLKMTLLSPGILTNVLMFTLF